MPTLADIAERRRAIRRQGSLALGGAASLGALLGLIALDAHWPLPPAVRGLALLVLAALPLILWAMCRPACLIAEATRLERALNLPRASLAGGWMLPAHTTDHPPDHLADALSERARRRADARLAHVPLQRVAGDEPRRRALGALWAACVLWLAVAILHPAMVGQGLGRFAWPIEPDRAAIVHEASEDETEAEETASAPQPPQDDEAGRLDVSPELAPGWLQRLAELLEQARSIQEQAGAADQAGLDELLEQAAAYEAEAAELAEALAEADAPVDQLSLIEATLQMLEALAIPAAEAEPQALHAAAETDAASLAAALDAAGGELAPGGGPDRPLDPAELAQGLDHAAWEGADDEPIQLQPLLQQAPPGYREAVGRYFRTIP